MNILVTGANGFVGKNLVTNLCNIKDNKNRTRPNIKIDEIFYYDKDSTKEQLEFYCQKADFVFHLAGINRPKDNKEFQEGNVDFTTLLLNTLKKYQNHAPIMLSSSIQATLIGRYNSEYGQSKKEAEKLLFKYSKETNVKVYVYRFPNLFGKWCNPNYNSVVATFCYNMIHDLPITINDENTELELLYIDDLIEGMFDLLEGKEIHCDFNGLIPILKETGLFCVIPKTHKVKLKEIYSYLNEFKNYPLTYTIPDIPNDSFKKKLFSTYLSYLPQDKIPIAFKVNKDERGSFIELLKTNNTGQISVNITKPGITKGEHYHNSKWELFIVVSGHGIIKQRKIGTKEIIENEVNGNNIQAITILPGYTHNITNLSNTDDLVTIMWANEQFDSAHPDTFKEEVEHGNNI